MMDQSGAPPHDAIWRFLADDHARLDSLLLRAGSRHSVKELPAYDQFRRAPLHHTAMEEKVLLPAAKRARAAPLCVKR
jgi:hypothetical protein